LITFCLQNDQFHPFVSALLSQFKQSKSGNCDLTNFLVQGTRMVAAMMFGLFVIASICTIYSADAHGYLASPRSRQLVAKEEGKWSPTGNEEQDKATPLPESCPHCANRQAVINGVVGTCGLTSSGYNYDAPKNILGNILPKKIQATYVQGQQVDLQVILTAHHKGHFTYKACALKADETTATQQCFDSNPLIFVQDNLYGAPKDSNYPDRAYIPLESYPGLQRVSEGSKYSHRFTLPKNIVGDRVLIQWQYWTANSCIYPGYNSATLPGTFFDQHGLSLCENIPLDGNGIPEQFWNCAEVTVTSSTGGGTTPVPVAKPVVKLTAKPVVKPGAKPVVKPVAKPVVKPVAKPSSSVKVPVAVGTCGNGVVGNGICPNKSLCCSQWGHCGTGSAYCPPPSKPSPPAVAGTCGNGVVGNGICPNKSLCCSQWGHCGTGSAYCG
jgi:hypothetical protein